MEKTSAKNAVCGKKLPNFLSLWNFQDPAGTEEKFQELLPIVEKSGGKGDLAELLTQIARAQGLQRQFQKAHDTLDEVAVLLKKATKKAEVRYLLERGRVFNSSGKLVKARNLFLKAWKVAKEAGKDSLAVDAAHMMAIVEQKDLDKSLKWNEIALKFVEKSDNKRAKGWLAPLYNNIAWAYHDKGDYNKAIAVFRKALVWHEKGTDENSIYVAKWCIARCLRSQGRFAEALKKQHELEKELKAKGKTDAFVFEELSENYQALKKEAEARKYFALAHREFLKNEWFKANMKAHLQKCKDKEEIKK